MLSSSSSSVQQHSYSAAVVQLLVLWHNQLGGAAFAVQWGCVLPAAALQSHMVAKKGKLAEMLAR